MRVRVRGGKLQRQTTCDSSSHAEIKTGARCFTAVGRVTESTIRDGNLGLNVMPEHTEHACVQLNPSIRRLILPTKFQTPQRVGAVRNRSGKTEHSDVFIQPACAVRLRDGRVIEIAIVHLECESEVQCYGCARAF